VGGGVSAANLTQVIEGLGIYPYMGRRVEPNRIEWHSYTAGLHGCQGSLDFISHKMALGF